MDKKLTQLKHLLAEITDLNRVDGLLGWDQQVYMPPEGAEARGHQLALMARLSHERQTSPVLGELLEALKPHAAALDPDSDDARLVQVTAKAYDKAVRVPTEWVEEFARTTAMAHGAWVEARQAADFSRFQPHLERIIGIARQYAAFFPEVDHPYDALLDVFEPGMKTADVKAIFETLRSQQVALIQAIRARPQVDDAFLHQPFDEQKQWDFGVEVVSRFGYDWQRGRQDKSPHPFTIGLGLQDVRITTRIVPNFLNSMLFGTMHECGHAFYYLGMAAELDRTGLDTGASFGIHESQSRTWENLVGRSLPFWEYYYPRLQQVFPQLADVSLERFYHGINKVEPSLVRVEADEATYNLHIMLRLEIETALIEGQLSVQDLPEYWNSKMEAYLGLTPPDDGLGVLQDVHWSMGHVGYFAAYALGNLISAQLWEQVNRDVPDLADQIRRGEFGALLAWQREKIHRHGAKFEPQELVLKVTGSKIDAAPYMAYLTHKYGEIYGI